MFISGLLRFKKKSLRVALGLLNRSSGSIFSLLILLIFIVTLKYGSSDIFISYSKYLEFLKYFHVSRRESIGERVKRGKSPSVNSEKIETNAKSKGRRRFKVFAISLLKNRKSNGLNCFTLKC